MTREEKKEAIAVISKIFTEAKGVYLTDFSGINVDTINDLRIEFRENNINYKIVKNTLTRLSIKDLSLDDLRPYLDGPTALAYSYDDALIPGKLIDKFHKKTELMPIKAALIDGTVYDQSMTLKIVNLPTRDELIARMLSTLNSPISGLVMVMNGILRNLVGVLDAVRSKKEAESGGDKHDTAPTDSGDKQENSEEAGAPEVTAKTLSGQETDGDASVEEKTNDAVDEAHEEPKNDTEKENNKEE